MSNPIEYVAGIVRDQHACYLLQFNKKLDQYVFPGGKVEACETRLAALERELMEELGIQVTKCTLYKLVTHAIGNQLYTGAYYVVDEYHGEVRNAEPEKARGIFYATRNHLLSLVRINGPEAIVVRAIEAGVEPIGEARYI